MAIPAGRRYLCGQHAGFTLVEMVVVCAIIALIVAIAAPQLMPALVFSHLDGSARHLAGYGTAAISYATLTRQDITIKFDLDKGEYETFRVNRTETTESSLFKTDAKESRDQNKLFDKSEDTEDVLDLMSRGETKLSNAQLQECGEIMHERFANYMKAQMVARARKIKKDEGLLKDIGPLFDKPFKLDESADEEPIKDPLLVKTGLPEGVVIEAIEIGTEEHTHGEVNVDLSPSGLMDQVTFYLRNEDDDYMTVIWDPVTASVSVKRGLPGDEDGTEKTDGTSAEGTAPHGAPAQAQ